MTESGSAREKVSAGAPGWMYTFAGMMLFLLCFFVLLLSFSSQDTLQFAKVSCALQEAFGVRKEEVAVPSQGGARLFVPAFETAPFDFRQELLQALEEEMKTGLVDVGEVQDSLVIRVKDTLAFASGRSELLPNFKPVLDKIGKIAREADASIVVSGHTDPVMQGKTFRTNWGLSTARAVGIVEYLIQKEKISSCRLSAVGYADGRPIANNSTPEGRARNRRIEFEVRPKVSGHAPGA